MIVHLINISTLVRCFAEVLSSGLAPAEIEYIQAHGSGTVHHDAMEVKGGASGMGVRRQVPANKFGVPNDGPSLLGAVVCLGHWQGGWPL
ncbi:hypothetical protein EBZ35_04100 [bacterium]|nr:hypothetical protein [bacterium]